MMRVYILFHNMKYVLWTIYLFSAKTEYNDLNQRVHNKQIFLCACLNMVAVLCEFYSSTDGVNC